MKLFAHVLSTLILLQEHGCVHGGCLTWEIEGNKVQFTCRVNRFVSTVSIFDMYDQEQARCSFLERLLDCESFHKNGSIESNNQTKEIIFKRYKTQNDVVNGEWTCVHGKDRYSTTVSSTDGIMTGTDVSIKGKFYQLNHENIQLNCFSCREPRGFIVEFIVDDRTVDTIMYSNAANKCFHDNRECRSDECSCNPSGNEYTKILPNREHRIGANFSCAMHFSDHITSSRFLKIATVFFNGKEFIEKPTITILTKEPAKSEDDSQNQDVSGTSRKDIEITSFKTVTDSKFPGANDREKLALSMQLVVAIVMCIAIIIGVLVIVCIYKSKRSSFNKLEYVCHDKKEIQKLGIQKYSSCRRINFHKDGSIPLHLLTIPYEDDSSKREDSSLRRFNRGKDKIPLLENAYEDDPTKIEDTKLQMIDRYTSTTDISNINKTQMINSYTSTTDVSQHNENYNIFIERLEAEEENVFETKAIKNLQEKVKTENILTIIGTMGSGKSTAMKHIALYLYQSEGYKIVVASSVEYIVRFDFHDQNYVFLIEDPFGKTSVDNAALKMWGSNSECIQKIIQTKQVKIISTSTSEIVNAEHIQKVCPFIKVFDLMSTSHQLNIAEREHIAKLHLRKDQVTVLKQWDVLGKFDYFPLLCHLFSKQNTNDISQFFDVPVVKRDLETVIIKSDKLAFLALFLFIIYNNCVSENLLSPDSDMEKTLDYVCKQCQFKERVSIAAMSKEIERLRSTYIKKQQTFYTMVHDRIFDIVVAMYGRHMLDLVLDFAHVNVIRDRFQLEVLDLACDVFVIKVPRVSEKRYFNRIIRDFKEGHVEDIFNNRQLTEQIFREKLIQHLNTLNDKLFTGIKFIDSFPLHTLAEKGYPDLVRVLLLCNLDGDIRNANGCTPLYLAASKNHTEVVKLLLEYKCDPNISNKYQKTPLYIASRFGHLNTVRILLSYNSKPNIGTIDNETPLLVASRGGYIDIVELLLQNYSDINISNKDSQTPLYIAASNGRCDIVDLLLQNGCERNKRDFLNETPLYVATYQGHIEVVRVLLKHKCDPTICNIDKQTPIHVASFKNYPLIIHLLLESNRKYLINATDNKGQTPLLIAADNGFTEIVEVLLKSRAKPDIMNNMSQSPLYLACQSGHIDIVKLLLQNGSDTNKVDISKNTPMHIASKKGFSEVVRLLLYYKGNPNAVNEQKQIPLFVATWHNRENVVQVLLQHNSKGYKGDRGKNTPLHVAARKALQIAVSEGHTRIVKLLLNNGFVPDIKEAQMLIDRATSKDYFEIVDLLKTIPMHKAS